MAIKYKDFEKREQLRKDYMDKAAEAAKTQANAYTDEQIRNIPAPPAPDIPTSLPQKYEAFEVQLVQGNISEGEDPMWSEYHETLWSGSEVLTNSSATTKAHFVTDTVLYWRSPRKYNLIITINGTEKEFVFEGEHNQYGTNWVIWQLKENDVVVAEAECIGAGNGQYYNNTSTVFVYCPDGSSYIGQTMTSARYGKKQYLYSLMNPAAILQYPSETENARFLTMCKSIATKNAKLKLTLTDNVIEANYANISNELVTTDYVNGDVRARWIGIVADRKPLAVGTYTYEDMKTCIKGVLEVEYTDEEATKECVYDKIQGESYTFKIGDFNHEESSAFDYYFNGAILIPFSNAQIQASFTYRPVSGTEKSVQVKSMVNNGQMLPYFDISELFGQAANTVMATITSNTAIENVDMGGRPVTTISLTSNVQNFTDANDEIMVGSILTLTPESLPQKYFRLNTALSKGRWKTSETFDWINGKEADTIMTYVVSWRFPKASKGAEYSIKLSDGTTQLFTVTGQNQQFSISINASTTPTGAQTAITVRLEVNADGSARILCSGANKEYHYIYTTIIVNNTSFYELENSAIKVNSEVRYILDANSYTIAKSAGLRKLIDKTEGKIRFTAELPPTSSIGSYLVVGETSAEGLAYIDDVLYTIPSSLPQTYKKKAVTLATSGWAVSDITDIASTSSTFTKNVSKRIGNTPYYSLIDKTSKIYITDTHYNFINEEMTFKHWNGFANVWVVNKNGYETINISIYAASDGEFSEGDVCIKYLRNDTPITSSVDVKGKIVGVTNGYNYVLTDADVKVNSEVRLTLDEANGKLAGQFGLKKTIDKEAGKLTFTADTLPTSAITGTLEIGDTSTEGAAFVDGIASEGIKANEENTFTAKQTFQDVQINGNLTAKGTTTTVDVKNLDVEQQLITVAKGNTAALTSPAGLKAEKYDGTKDGALVFDASGTAMVGDVVLDANGNIDAAQSDLQDLATRAKPSELTDGHYLKWDGTNKKIVDGGAISSGAIKGKRFTFTEDNIVKLGNNVNFSMTTSQNYAVGSTSSRAAVAADNRGMLQFEVGKSYKLEYQVSDGTKTTVYAVASSMALSDGTTVAKAEFAVNGKTLVVVDRATATANITSEASLTYSLTGAVAYFSDFSTVAEYLPIHVFTIPKEYYVRIPFDETILSTDIVAIFTDKIAPTSVTHTTSYIELNYGVSSSVYYLSDSAGIRDFAEYLIGTDYYLAVVGSSTTGGAYVVSAKQENINEKSTTVLVSEWVSETGGTFKWTDDGAASSSLIEVGVVWNSEVKLSFATDTDKETFEAAGCKIVSGKTFATPLTITCTTKPTKPICFTYTVRNNAR